MSTESESFLWSLFKEGDWNAYKVLYNSYFKLLNNYGYKFTKDVSLIEDAVHDLFVKLWTNRSNLGAPASVKNYLFKSLRSIIFRKLHKQSRFTDIDGEYPFSFEMSFDQVIITNEEERALRDRIKSVLDTLPARQREIVYLRFYEGLDYAEISELMEINVNSTYKLLYKALGSIEILLQTSKVLVFYALFAELKEQLSVF